MILLGPGAVADKLRLLESRTIVFDELHKYPHWKNFIKGFYDTYAKNRFHIVVTGSARLDLYRKGADSLMGRYFLYRMHPLSVAEVIHAGLREHEITAPARIRKDDFSALIRFGGFPEPYLKRNSRFYNRWKRTRLKLLFREDLRDTTKIYEVGQVELLAELLRQQAGQLTNFAALARKIRASQDSIRRWVSALESLYYCFTIRPWSRNISRSLLKGPKTFLWDWSLVDDEGTRNENFVASHLLKAVQWWVDNGFGDYELYFLRTKDQREVDFLVTKNREPWFLVEVKTSAGQALSRNLDYFQTRTGAKHAFQLSMNADFIDADCFEIPYPITVPGQTFLSQLV
ncbi:MAG: ATP-binding protein [Deltaproteobacteria bacterium]|nr:ATP-binding protein [Deltaproteobacteria bacterium]